MGDQRRHAIYFAPRPGPLAAFGAAWLGWDAETGAVPERLGLALPGGELTAAPRRYGFHATLKAPFRLAPGRDEADLDAAIADLAAEHAPFDLQLALGSLGPFLALLPMQPQPALRRLADACVVRLDRFRAPPAPAEIARRRGGALDAGQSAHLERWGYPYVLDRFRFHMTLTGPLGPDEQEPVHAILAEALAPLLAAPVAVADICRFTEDDAGHFRLAYRHPLYS